MRLFCVLILCLIPVAGLHASESEVFADKPLEQKIVLPEWFKLSFLDLQDDIDEAGADGKKGIIIYFGQKRCPYCKAFLTNSWGREDIVNYTRKNFDVVAIDTKGVRSVTDIDGFVYDEKSFSKKLKTQFTPSLLFYNLDGKRIFRLTGYQSPYRFMAALEYIADGHYQRQKFKDYLNLAGADAVSSAGNEELNNEPYFDSPPFNLSRNIIAAQQPLAVIFEKPSCHSCDILHAHPLAEKNIVDRLKELQVVQLNINSDEKLVTPVSKRTTAKQWADQLQISYTPTVVFFDEHGKEIIRIDSVVWVNRLGAVLDYIRSKGYQKYPYFQQWKESVQNN